jgi:hypothetical protein
MSSRRELMRVVPFSYPEESEVYHMPNRIAPEVVVAGYKKSEMEVNHNIYAGYHHFKRCGCGLTAVATAQNNENFDIIIETLNPLETLGLLLDVSWDYIVGFDAGFLGRNTYLPKHTYLGAVAGYHDGLAARNAVMNM